MHNRIMTIIERLEQDLATALRTPRGISIWDVSQAILIDPADLSAVLECVKAQYAWINRKNYAPTQWGVVMDIEKKVGLG